VDTFSAYVAGFFDGEGWVVIGRERKAGRSDVHRIAVYLTQRARYRDVLGRVQSEFGGTVSVRDTKIRATENWAEQADWHIHTREQIERFCLAVQPYCIVKAPQIAIALEFVQGFQASSAVRDSLGRIHGKHITTDELERRERLRMALKESNARGPLRTVRIERPTLDVQRLERAPTLQLGDRSTFRRGEALYNAKLTEDAVRAIRAAHAAGGVTLETLAIRYGVSPAAVRQVLRGLTWAHVT
jgi:hypothetical protein